MNLQNELLMNYKENSTFIGYEKLGNQLIISSSFESESKVYLDVDLSKNIFLI